MIVSHHVWASAALLLASLGWAVALVIEPEPWEPNVASVLAAGLLVLAAVSATAVMVENSRTGYWTGVFGVALMLTIAALRTLDTAWVVATSITAVAGVLMADRRLGGWIRMEGPVAPVPGPATGLSLLLLACPPVTALAMTDRPAGGIVWLALATWAVLLVFVRRLPGAVAAVRLGVPILTGAGAVLELPGAAIWVTLMITASVLAWSKPVRLAIRPLIERGTRVSIPPEFLPDDVKRAFGIDREPR